MQSMVINELRAYARWYRHHCDAGIRVSKQPVLKGYVCGAKAWSDKSKCYYYLQIAY